MTKFEIIDVETLLCATAMTHRLKPDTKDRIVYGIEEAKPGDRNIIFHMIPIDRTSNETSVVMISAQLIVDEFGG